MDGSLCVYSTGQAREGTTPTTELVGILSAEPAPRRPPTTYAAHLSAERVSFDRIVHHYYCYFDRGPYATIYYHHNVVSCWRTLCTEQYNTTRPKFLRYPISSLLYRHPIEMHLDLLTILLHLVSQAVEGSPVGGRSIPPPSSSPIVVESPALLLAFVHHHYIPDSTTSVLLPSLLLLSFVAVVVVFEDDKPHHR